MAKHFVTIVSGLPRSGTSMMMQMIEAGGIPSLTDNIRKADQDNPRGYYEFEPVKKTKESPSWLNQAQGRVVKMVYRLLYDLPQGHQYRVVFMRRDMQEVLASQAKMLQRLGKEGGRQDDEKMGELFQRELVQFDRWVADRGCFSVLNVEHKDMIHDARAQAERVNEFLGGDLDVEAMAAGVDPSLYRQRR